MMVDTKHGYYRLSVEECIQEVASTARGLTKTEAATRLRDDGPNQLRTGQHKSHLVGYLRQYKDLMVLLLLGSSLLSFWLDDLRTGIVLLVLVLFNTTIGFLQEFKAEQVMQSLEKLVINEATVLRDEHKTTVPTSELVRGDVVYVEEGSSIPADMRLISEDELSTNDFALTGESNPSRKFLHAIQGEVLLANRHNLVFMGTTVATGSGYGVVIGTGMHTELGRIAGLSQDIRQETSPLQKEMNNIATRVTQGTVILCAILLPIATSSGLTIKDAFLFAIGIASSIIPQGLPAEISTALAQAASTLARAKALVKKLSSVETLGATNIICTDKTGTLTKNQMTVEQFMVGDKVYSVTGKGYEPSGIILDIKNEPLSKAEQSELELVFMAGAFASNARVSAPDEEHATWYCIGDPTEGAIVALAAKSGLDCDALDTQYPELKELTFDSSRKRMSSLRYYGAEKELHAFIKGSPESVLEKCSSIWKNGKVYKLSADQKQKLLQHNNLLAGQAMRNLGIAYRVLPKAVVPKTATIETVETGLTWLGLVSMIDPLREQVPNAMIAARQAHIKVAVITGDHAITARAIAARAQLTDDPNDITIVQGQELNGLDDTQILSLLQRGGVIFSRVAPEDKLRIVKLVQDNGKVVAVTGDGINDAPALKQADIGVAMGLTGTDVAKQSAEIILLDDSFTTLVGAIQQGRIIFQNIKKGALSAFTSNAGELVVNLLSLGAATLFHIPLAITVMEILAIDLIAELFPIAALGKDKADGELMRNPPRKVHDHILTLGSVIDLLWCGLLMGGFAFLNYLWFFTRNGIESAHLTSGSPIHMQATALTYLTIVLCQLANILQRRTEAGLFSRYQFHNRQFWFAMTFSIFCVVNIIYNPWIAPYFKAGPLSFIDWVYAIGAASLFIAIREFQRHNRKHHRKVVLALNKQLHIPTQA